MYVLFVSGRLIEIYTMENITPHRSMRPNHQMIYGLELLCKLLPENIVGAEIGSYAGESAQILISSGKFVQLHCIDPWDPNYYSGRQLISAEAAFDEKHANDGRIVKLKGYSYYHLPKLQPDFVYIDGNHAYEAVKQDVQLAMKYLTGAKILAGHDYGYKKSPGVKQALDELIGKPDAIFCDYSWIKFL